MRNSQIAIQTAIGEFVNGVVSEMGVGLKTFKFKLEKVCENEDVGDGDIQVNYVLDIELDKAIPNKYNPEYYPDDEDEEWDGDFAYSYWKGELNALEKTLDRLEDEDNIYINPKDVSFFMSEKYGYSIEIPISLVIQPIREFNDK